MSMPKEFENFSDLVQDALDDFGPQDESCFYQVLVETVRKFGPWRKDLVPDLVLSPTSHLPTFKARVGREIFPLIISSMLLVRTYWSGCHKYTFDSSLSGGTLTFDKSNRRTVQYWLGNVIDRLTALRREPPNLLQLGSTSCPILPDAQVPTLQHLIDHAVHLETNSQQLRLISHIYYCAAALREMCEIDNTENEILPHHRTPPHNGHIGLSARLTPRHQSHKPIYPPHHQQLAVIRYLAGGIQNRSHGRTRP
ncbi:uncharacterized protein EI90DRAFT_1772561 [Cantharellus anzutake]|uniref:uncharacterized protein n=1 Tax=Cantharellus anzutake TaxID=1750568 RepID=UPI001908AB7C|nr:uncharacterized protein EI90DRAFT_1772561 [Cantharellus anzutake]KAF8327632.1 hypothetical protein EI90DRAFT_1772561 [Cantharellus anzutake]